MQAKFTAVMSLSWVLQLELALELEQRSSLELHKKLLRSSLPVTGAKPFNHMGNCEGM
jgi:hypothetical protein